MCKLIVILLIMITPSCFSQDLNSRWQIVENGKIGWKITTGIPHYDHIEMSGKYISTVIRYGVNSDKSFWINRDLVFPMLRTIPNNTHASLIRSFNIDAVSLVTINRKLIAGEQVSEIVLDGKLTVNSFISSGVKIKRTLCPSTDFPLWLEKYEIANFSTKVAYVEIPELNYVVQTDETQGTEGVYSINVRTINYGSKSLLPGDSLVFYMTISGVKANQDIRLIDPEKELLKRDSLLAMFKSNLVLETPDTVINNAFGFAKIRAAESIYQTKGGPMHGPGGLSYYAAIWANDQAEYINPFFPYLGYDYGNESAINAFRHFARFMNDQYKPIPSSIIAEGTDIWNGAGDRGDAAMIAYGAARFALSSGSKSVANELWPLIEWCLEFNKRKLNANGVVNSDSDELEGRFPSGSANLCTSSLYYDALISAVFLGNSIGKDKKLIEGLKKQSTELRVNIEKHFGSRVMGFDTYRYYEGNDILRSWICMPLTVGIFDRTQGTIDALFSDKLWTDDGLATQSGDKTFWDRSTLYALRGVFAAGETQKGLNFLRYYSQRRLLGEHVPYPVEAYPEGNQRHLSAESALYCRIFTEGLFGIRPTGLNSFTITPQLPNEWDFMHLRNVHGFSSVFDIDVKREKNKVRVTVTDGGKVQINRLVENKSTLNVKFDNN